MFVFGCVAHLLLPVLLWWEEEEEEEEEYKGIQRKRASSNRPAGPDKAACG